MGIPISIYQIALPKGVEMGNSPGFMDTVELSNHLVKFEFDRRTGSLVQIEDRIGAKRYLSDKSHSRLFRVICPNAVWQSRFADSHEADPPGFECNGQTLSICYDRLRSVDGPVDVSVKVRIRLPEDSPEALFGLELTNNGTDRLHEIRFPWVAGWTGLAGPEQDKAYCGCVPVKLYPDKPETFAYNLAGSRRREFYAYTVATLLPFFDLSGGDCGLSYICYQERPNLGGMVIENLDPEPDGLSLSWSWVHFPFTRPQENWRSPLIGIGIHHGDWHITADRFRTWADTWWKAPTVPERLRTKIGFQTIQTRGFDGKPLRRFSDIPELAREGLEFGVEDLCIWDPIAGVYLRPDEGDFWEEFDSSQNLDHLRKGLAEAKRLGVNVSTLVNFRLIRGNSKLYREIGEEQVQRTIFGTPVAERSGAIAAIAMRLSGLNTCPGTAGHYARSPKRFAAAL